MFYYVWNDLEWFVTIENGYESLKFIMVSTNQTQTVLRFIMIHTWLAPTKHRDCLVVVPVRLASLVPAGAPGPRGAAPRPESMSVPD